MYANKLHYNADGLVYGFGNIDSEQYIEVENFDEALEAFNARKTLRVVDGQLVINESRAERLNQVRQARDGLLAASDVLKLKLEDAEDISGTPDVQARQRLAVYRQALRDITLQDPFEVNWPVLEAANEE